MRTNWEDSYLYGESFTKDEFEYYYNILHKKYFTDNMIQQNIEMLKKRGGSDSWKHIALWACDVIKEREDYILPTVLNDLWETMVERKIVLKYTKKGRTIYCLKG